MAFLGISMTSVLLILLALYLSDHVTADDEFVRNICHNAEVPETCFQCVKSDSRNNQTDTVLIATIVVDCVTTHADNLHGNMSDLALKAKDAGKKEALEECRDLFSYAKNDLFAATLGLKSGDFDTADRAVYTAVLYFVSCSAGLQTKGVRIDFPQEVVYELKIYEELTEAAMRIINRL